MFISHVYFYLFQIIFTFQCSFSAVLNIITQDSERLLYSKRFHHQKKVRVEQILKEVGLFEKRHQPVTKLSGGQRQRVAIARAMVNDASVLLCDEPTGALDRATGDEIIRLFMELHEQGKTLIIVTHDETVAKHCERVIRITDGRIEQ